MLALIGAAALVVWLARTDEDGRAPARSGPRDARVGRTTPVVELAPPSASTTSTSTIVAPRAATRVPVAPVPQDELAPFRLDEGGLSMQDPSDPAPTIRGVRGLVREARTGLPIAHAWLTWQPPGIGADEWLDRLGPEDVATGMVTGADGRFDVDRLPDDEQVSSTLYAVASGYAAIGLRPGLREEVVFDLVPMGSLEVRITGLTPLDPTWDRPGSVSPGRVPPAVTIEPVPEDPTRPAAAALVDPRSVVARAARLAPGRWRVSFRGAAPQVVEVSAGGTAVVELTLAPAEEITGTVAGCSSGVLLLAEADGGGAPHRFALTEGSFRGRLRAGRYRATLELDEDGDGSRETERKVPDVVEVRPGESRLLVQAPARGDQVQVALTRAGLPYRSAGLGLVALDEANQGSLIALFPDAERPGLHRGEAPAGRYALFEEGRLLASDLPIPTAGVVVASDRAAVQVRFLVPSTLRSHESLRGVVALVPQLLQGDAARRFRWAETARFGLTRDAAVVTLQIVAPGRYLLTGETDLGPFEAWVDLAPGVEVTVPLGE